MRRLWIPAARQGPRRRLLPRRLRRRIVLTSSLTLVAAAVFVSAGPAAQALTTYDVNGGNTFELDGNLCHDGASVPPVDWANTNNTDCSGSGAAPVGLFNTDESQALQPGTTVGQSSLIASTLCDDVNATTSCPGGTTAAGTAVPDLAFISGSSKDGIDPNGNWNCTVKPVTPKDEINHASAALFSEPATAMATLATAIVGTTTQLSLSGLNYEIASGDSLQIGTGGSAQVVTATQTVKPGASVTVTVTSFTATAWSIGTPVKDVSNHQVLYMSLERGIVNGTSNAGFWLFQNSLSCPSTGGTFTTPAPATTTHKNGDLLVFATFNSGGAICPGSNVTSVACVDAFDWQNGSLQSAPVIGGLGCTTSLQGACGMVNSGSVSPPWDTSSVPANGFFEVGVDITDFYADLGTSIPCFSNFLADTRSSGSQGNAVSSALHDFMLTNFNTCGSTTMKATPAAASPATIHANQPTVLTFFENNDGSTPLANPSVSLSPNDCTPALGGGGGTLTSAATVAGAPYTTLDISPLTAPIQSGDSLSVGGQAATASAAAAAGATSISVDSFTPSSDYGVGTYVLDTTNIGDTNANGNFDPGETWVFSCVDNTIGATGTITATGNGYDLSGNDVTYCTSGAYPCNTNERTTVTVTVINPGTSLLETASAVITYTFKEKNTSADAPLTNPSVAGSQCTSSPVLISSGGSGTLASSSALTSGTAYGGTTFATLNLGGSGLTAPITAGDSIQIGTGGTTQVLTAYANALKGDTSIEVKPFTANDNYASGTAVTDLPILNPQVTWTYQCTYTLAGPTADSGSTNTTNVGTGSGTDVTGTNITYPGYPSEQDSVTVTITNNGQCTATGNPPNCP